MKTVKTAKRNWVAISYDGRVLSDGYQAATPAAARRAGEKEIMLECVRKNSGDSAAIKWILENL